MAAIISSPFAARHSQTQACIFTYHRVANIGFIDPNVDPWNVPPGVFEKQIEVLAEFAEFVHLVDLPSRLKQATPFDKPLVALTFDDGYANFYTEALPILKRYNAPATLFVVTNCIGESGPLKFDGWSLKNSANVPSDTCRSITWSELEACITSGLVHVGAHSHRHLKGRECTDAQMIDEAEQSRALLLSHLGEKHAQLYAYPYGSTRLGFVPPAYVSAVRSAGYTIAVTSDLGLASADDDPFLLPRIEAHEVDVPGVLRAKALGVLGPYYLTDRLRRVKRAV